MAAGDLEQRIQKLEDIEAIRQLKSHYFVCCDRKDPVRMRACFVDGPIDIDYGVVGTFKTADALIEVYTAVGCHDYMVELHHGANPQIEVLSSDAARGTWNLHYYLINTQAKSLTQLAGYYEDEYRKLNGRWKISATRFVATSTLAMDINEGLAKVLFAGRAVPMPA